MCSTNSEPKIRTKLCFNQADYDGMRQFARRELQHIDCELMSASMLWSHFSTVR